MAENREKRKKASAMASERPDKPENFDVGLERALYSNFKIHSLNAGLADILKLDSNRYKLSCYNIITTSDRKTLLLFNTKTGAFGLINRQNMENSNNNQIILNDFLENGYLVEKNKDEINEVIDWFRVIRNDRSVMRLILLPAEVCNFRCSYCYESFRNIKMSGKIAQSIINFVQRKISGLKILELSWFGGEPLLAVDWVIYITKVCQSLAERYRVEFISDITTNGYLLSPSLLQDLIKAGIKSYQVTVDGISRVHNRFRKLRNGEGTFQKLWTNIKAMKEFGEINVTVRTNFDEYSAGRLTEWIEQYNNEFGANQRFKLVFRPIFNFEHNDNKITSEIKVCSLDKSISIENNSAIKLWAKLNFPFTYFNEILLPNPKKIYCYGGLPQCFVIGADGKIWKCSVALNDTDAIGYLKEDGEIEMIHQKLDEWNYYTENWVYDNECKKCLFLPLCMGGCILARRNGKKGCYFSLDALIKVMKTYFRKCMKGGD